MENGVRNSEQDALKFAKYLQNTFLSHGGQEDVALTEKTAQENEDIRHTTLEEMKQEI